MSELMSRTRIEALSDGIFAIVLTLLVLEIKVPHLSASHSLPDMAKALFALAPKFISWVISFFTVCVIWLNHHRLFEMIEKLDRGLFWWNANLLLWISFLPFPTALMGDYPENRLAVSFYGGVMFLLGIGFVLLRQHLHRKPELLKKHVNQVAFHKGIVYTILFGPLAYLVGASLAWGSTIAAFICYGAVSFYFLTPHASRTTLDPFCTVPEKKKKP